MRYFLNLVYVVLLAVASPLIIYSAMFAGKYREGFAAKFLGWVPRRAGERPCIWLHGVSVGEVNVLVHLIPRLEQMHPDHDFVISTTTRTGFELARARFADNIVCYCPLDFSWAVSTAFHRLHPALLVLVELELWPNLIAAAQRHGARVVVVNGRLSESSWRGYRRVRAVMRRVLRRVDQVATQNVEYAERFRDLGAPRERVCVTGSMKFDGAETSRDNPRTLSLKRLSRLRDDELVFLAGSTQSPEERVCLSVFQQLSRLYPRLRLILVPRHPERFEEVGALLAESGVRWIRRSRMVERPADDRARGSEVILVDTVGELSAWWGLADIGFVGGSLGSRGGQNMIEPAAYGVATCFGPNTRNFRDVVEALRQADAAETVHDQSELQAFVSRCISDETYRKAMGERARRLVASQRGATAITCKMISQWLGSAQTDQDSAEHTDCYGSSLPLRKVS
jgi:3-deoxy-D-manno-octulosonic-acid transferase